MANTYTLISSNTLTSATASVTFSSIPATYTDLVLRISARSTGSYGSFKVNFNSDTATNYSDIVLYGNGSSATSGQDSNSNTAFLYFGVTPSSNTADTFGNAEIYIPNYQISANKQFGYFGVTENNNTATNMAINSALWRNTATISSISIATNNTFVSGSSFYLYGIKNS